LLFLLTLLQLAVVLFAFLLILLTRNEARRAQVVTTV
jgi:hypothetical protein